MLNDLLTQIKHYQMVSPGDRVNCAVSGGADSMALLWGLYLLREQLDITLAAAHFNHHLRGSESDGEEIFVREFCQRFDIPLYVGSAQVTSGKKGLEAAARDARYAFFDTLPGKLATAHTADDNAETMLMHLIRGAGLKGLGGIAPVCGRRIRPMLHITRQQVLDFLEEYHIPHKEDSSNAEDGFLRNRLRHHVMPLLKAENPKLCQTLSATAERLRYDEEYLAEQSSFDSLPDVDTLRSIPRALRYRMLEAFLKQCGVFEPGAEHLDLANALVFSSNPSARASFPGGVSLGRNYHQLELLTPTLPLKTRILTQFGALDLPELGLRMICVPADAPENNTSVFTVNASFPLVLRCRQSGDRIAFSGGSKSVKKLFIDKKVPACQRLQIPIVADGAGILGVLGFGADVSRIASSLPAVQIRFESITADAGVTER